MFIAGEIIDGGIEIGLLLQKGDHNVGSSVDCIVVYEDIFREGFIGDKEFFEN